MTHLQNKSWPKESLPPLQQVGVSLAMRSLALALIDYMVAQGSLKGLQDYSINKQKHK